MKKIVLVLVILYVPLLAQPSVRFECGKSTYFNIYFTEVETSYKLSIPIKNNKLSFQTYGNFLNWQTPNGDNFKPIEITYKIGEKISWKNMFIKFEHYCNHPVISSAIPVYNENHELLFAYVQVSPYWWRGGQQTISFGFEHTFN
jgi:hypothetical protein